MPYEEVIAKLRQNPAVLPVAGAVLGYLAGPRDEGQGVRVGAGAIGGLAGYMGQKYLVDEQAPAETKKKKKDDDKKPWVYRASKFVHEKGPPAAAVGAVGVGTVAVPTGLTLMALRRAVRSNAASFDAVKQSLLKDPGLVRNSRMLRYLTKPKELHQQYLLKMLQKHLQRIKMGVPGAVGARTAEATAHRAAELMMRGKQPIVRRGLRAFARYLGVFGKAAVKTAKAVK